MDGYFPSELQARYPDGVPLQVSSAKLCSHGVSGRNGSLISQ